MRGERLPHERLKTHRAAKIEIKSYPPLAVHADGQYLGVTPVTVEVVPNALLICVPTPELPLKFADENNSYGLPYDLTEQSGSIFSDRPSISA